MPRQIFQLKMTLVGVRPTVWRRVLVPAGYTLDRLHRVVQYAMGWRDCHLHSFDIDAVQYGEPDPDGELAFEDELDVRLDAVLGKGSRFSYLYDFGDWWEHDLVVEDALTADPDERYPVCLDGERACPPESVGGPSAYRALLVALADPTAFADPGYAALRDWAGPTFDPSWFDAPRTSTLLRRLT
ncbi:plasmid pRiA4b ORF-3 family protein [Micromonospora vulcania]|uniref:Plasmid pRiA4b ORF-3 family protein n=1 Tax=Micromonospora vulcania TaxID=1441873 RepID=A0ABW1H0L5_9ACTN